jgi:hypothetical protein
MLADNVRLPTFTAEIPIEIPQVPILPTTQRASPPIEIETPTMEHPIITAAGAHTHPAPPGRGANHTKEHLQSDRSRPQVVQKPDEQVGKFEGDWHVESGNIEAQEFKFEPEKGEISSSDKTILVGIIGLVALWALFGP